MIDCDKCTELISCLLDGELDEEEQALVREHMASCPDCRRVYEAFSAISGQLREPEPLPEGLHERIMSGIPARPKRKTGIVWIKYLSAAACIALVIVAGAKSGVFAPGSDGADENLLKDAQTVTNGTAQSFSDDRGGDGEGLADERMQAAWSAAVGIDEATAEKLTALLTPAQDDPVPASGAEPDYALSLPGGETLLLYLDGETVCADFGDGVFLTQASADEIRALLE